ncbi:MAG: response regulator [Chloroflexi bacterium]|nr:response regulator [Chloroflexota bacterium]
MGTTIMIADDEASLRRLMEATLRDDPRYRMVVATNGVEALEMARREKPNLVFLDVRMPRMSGLEVCHALKSDPVTRHITIVMVTALGTDDDRQRAREAGADDYLVKPFSPTDLLEKLEKVLGRMESKDGAPAMGRPALRDLEAPPLERMGQEQLVVYAQELRRLFLEERTLRGELEEKNRQLEQGLKEIRELNRMVQAHLSEDERAFRTYRELFLDWRRLANEMQALAVRGDSLPQRDSLGDAGATSQSGG